MRVTAILALVVSPATRRQGPNLHEMIVIPMRLKRNPMANPVKSKYSMGNLMIRTKNPSGAAVWTLVATSEDDDVVGPSDSESFLSERDELLG